MVDEGTRAQKRAAMAVLGLATALIVLSLATKSWVIAIDGSGQNRAGLFDAERCIENGNDCWSKSSDHDTQLGWPIALASIVMLGCALGQAMQPRRSVATAVAAAVAMLLAVWFISHPSELFAGDGGFAHAPAYGFTVFLAGCVCALVAAAMMPLRAVPPLPPPPR